ncbi:hypothetical protein HPP92_009002 [Vanilla planifolia]|uniref:Uncharacterized protein n=1 Tax=Vanilla planifolia TaxID=51239 RepID=A0A835REE9_VANPL|nr:hypothetical protein HPP92_009002 [Vanilla planifolia]
MAIWDEASNQVSTARINILLPHRPRRRLDSFRGSSGILRLRDSLVDSGNNNYAMTARADSPPYGIDYPTHRPTGEHLGAESTLPYLSPDFRGQKLLVGANFASAGIGILNDTGIQFVNIIRISQQLQYFGQYQQRLSALVGAAREEAGQPSAGFDNTRRERLRPQLLFGTVLGEVAPVRFAGLRSIRDLPSTKNPRGSFYLRLMLLLGRTLGRAVG